MSNEQLVAAWSEYDRLDALWIASVASIKTTRDKSSYDAEFEAHRLATSAWFEARSIGPRPAKRND